MSNEEAFLLFANCVPVKGARRSVICDLQKSRAQYIPNGLYDILTTMAGWTLSRIKAEFEPSQSSLIDEYFAVLEKRHFGHWTREPEAFPRLNLEWRRPESITNMIVDVDAASTHDYSSIAEQLQESGCLALQIRFYDACQLSEIAAVLKPFEATPLRHIDVIAAYQPEMSVDALDAFCRLHPAVTTVAVHSSPAPFEHAVLPYSSTVSYFAEPLEAGSCGRVHPSYFTFAIEHFTEAQSYNTCLNRKLSIAADGSLRSCPAMACSYGEAKVTRFADVMRREEFVQIGRISKDQVEVCRDCEFRYVCTDCRAVLSDPANIYSKPAHCGYDPYRATWQQAPSSNFAATGVSR